MSELEEEEWWKDLEGAKPEDTNDKMRVAKVAMNSDIWSRIEAVALEKGWTFSQAATYLIQGGWVVEIAFQRHDELLKKNWLLRITASIWGFKDVITVRRKPTTRLM